jgi:hypothetical protein
MAVGSSGTVVVVGSTLVVVPEDAEVVEAIRPGDVSSLHAVNAAKPAAPTRNRRRWRGTIGRRYPTRPERGELEKPSTRLERRWLIRARIGARSHP